MGIMARRRAKDTKAKALEKPKAAPKAPEPQPERVAKPPRKVEKVPASLGERDRRED